MKKIFVILSVLLILSVALIPCFATAPKDYQIEVINPFSDYLQNASSYHSSYTSVSYDFDTNVLTVTILQSGLLNYQLGVYTSRCTFYKDRYYLFFVTSDRQLYLQTNSFFAIPTTVYKYPFNNFSARSLLMPGTGATGTYSISRFYAIDVTDLYNDGYTTRSEIEDYLSDYLDLTDYYIPSGYYHLSGTFQPLGDLYNNLLHSWDYFPDLWTKHSALLALLAAAVGGIGITAVIILIIKRCKK